MEEYSTDEEEDEQEKKDLLPPVDPVGILLDELLLLVFWAAINILYLIFLCHKSDTVFSISINFIGLTDSEICEKYYWEVLSWSSPPLK